jgi:hypothetical protein
MPSPSREQRLRRLTTRGLELSEAVAIVDADPESEPELTLTAMQAAARDWVLTSVLVPEWLRRVFDADTLTGEAT